MSGSGWERVMAVKALARLHGQVRKAAEKLDKTAKEQWATHAQHGGAAIEEVLALMPSLRAYRGGLEVLPCGPDAGSKHRIHHVRVKSVLALQQAKQVMETSRHMNIFNQFAKYLQEGFARLTETVGDKPVPGGLPKPYKMTRCRMAMFCICDRGPYHHLWKLEKNVAQVVKRHRRLQPWDDLLVYGFAVALFVGYERHQVTEPNMDEPEGNNKLLEPRIGQVQTVWMHLAHQLKSPWRTTWHRMACPGSADL